MEKNLETRPGSSESVVSAAELLAMQPQLWPYKFIDEILEFDRTHVVARYRLRKDEFFFPVHFPERPVTPGTILLEAMCQCGVTTQSYFLLAQELGIETAMEYRILFTGSEVEWFELVGPGSLIIMRSDVLAWRMRRIHARVKMHTETGSLVAEARVSGMSVLWSSNAAPSATRGGKNEEREVRPKTLKGAPHDS